MTMRRVEVHPDFVIAEQVNVINKLTNENITLRAYIKQMEEELESANINELSEEGEPEDSEAIA